MNEIQRVCYTEGELHVREAAEGKESRTIEGYAILFNTQSRVLWGDDEMEAREEISPEAITRELLDMCDIKMNLFHDRQLVLARSQGGKGTLSYDVDERGVRFWFDAPRTADGDKALELVGRGDLCGCSFAFATAYGDSGCVSREVAKRDGKTYITYRVKKVYDVRDFALVFDPAYEETDVSLRSLMEAGNDCADVQEPLADSGTLKAQIREMRSEKYRKF